MSVTREVRASCKQVWDVVADGWTYSQWVVGNSRMRAVDPNWPAPGSTVRHSVGLWPLVINDETVVEKSVPEAEIVLLAKARPVMAARVTLRLNAIPGGCRIEMDELAVGGPLKWLPNKLQALVLWPRNYESLWRLGALSQRLRPSDLD